VARPSTRQRILDSATRLFRYQGYAATGIKSILTDSDAPYGSLYHHFPGGKSDLGVAAIRAGAEVYRRLVVDYFDNERPLADCARDFFDGAAELLEATDFQDACPIATIAMEIAHSDDGMRRAAAEAYESWIAVLVGRLRRDGYPDQDALALAVQLFCALEGAFVHARTTRTTTALDLAGRGVISAILDREERAR
jgi:AcrR family transcriptional regulator